MIIILKTCEILAHAKMGKSPNQSIIQRHGFEQNLFSQLLWLIALKQA